MVSDTQHSWLFRAKNESGQTMHLRMNDLDDSTQSIGLHSVGKFSPFFNISNQQ